MATGAQGTDFSPKAKANHYMREVWRKGTSMKNANAQRIDNSLIVVSQCTVKLRVGVKHQTSTCLQHLLCVNLSRKYTSRTSNNSDRSQASSLGIDV